MAPLLVARALILILIIAFVTGLAFFFLTASPARHCPPERPLRVEDGSCVPESFEESDGPPGRGRAVIRAILAGLAFAAPTCVYLLLTWPG